MTPASPGALSAIVTNGDLSNSRFREMMDAVPVAIYTTDADGLLTYFNPAAVKLSGRTPELGSDSWCVTWKIFTPDGTRLPHNQCPMALALKGQDVPADIECLAERPDGSRFWFTPYPAALRDSHGRIVGGVNILIDITDRKAAEIKARDQFRAIVDTTPECVKIVARDGTLLFMNSPGLAMIGAAAPEAVVGKSVYDLIAPEDRQKFRALNERVCRGAKAVMEFDIIGLNRERLHMETHAAPLHDLDGTTVHLAITREITVSKRDEQNTLLLSAIVDSSDDAIVSKNLDGVVTSWNKGAERLFGFKVPEAVGKPIANLIIPSDRQDEELDILARLRRGERMDHFETVRRRKDGALLDVSLTISPVRDRDGRIVGASKIARDISDRKRVERAIRALNGQLSADLDAMTRIQQLSTRMIQAGEFTKLLDETVSSAVEITTADMGTIQLLEDGRLKIAAHRGFEAPFLNFFESVSEGAAACGTALQRAERVIIEDVASSPVFKGTEALTVMLGAGVLAVESTPLITRSGQIVGMLSTHYRTCRRPADRDLRLLDVIARQTADLIERSRAEAALLISESRFRQLADSMPQIVWTARPDGYIDYYNQRWYERTGSPRDVFGDSSWEPILHPEDLPRTRETYYAAIRSEQPYNLEYRLWDRNENRFRWFVGRALPVRDADRTVVKWFGTSTDIDEQKCVQEELRRANQDLEQFAFSASHDLQEPLRTINIYSELIEKRYGPALADEALTFFRYVRESAARMEMLLSDLLEYTRVTKIEKPAQSSSAAEALDFALSSLAEKISEAGARVTAGALPDLPVPATHLRQLFQNLVGNAVKYRSRERTPLVHVSAVQRSSQWVFSVQDNGIGIPPEYSETIFGLFKRLHNTGEYSGTGIGLAICQRIVDRYQGRIWVESKPGQGSNFQFTLPV